MGVEDKKINYFSHKDQEFFTYVFHKLSLKSRLVSQQSRIILFPHTTAATDIGSSVPNWTDLNLKAKCYVPQHLFFTVTQHKQL